MSATNGYPFQSKRAIAETLRIDREYALAAFRILLARTAQRTAATQGAFGFMASHGATVRELATTLEERPFNDAEHTKLASLLCHYAKQLAAHFRTIELQARPELLQIASVFSAIPGISTGSSEATEVDDADDADGELAADAGAKRSDDAGDGESPATVDAPARRRPGRPKGSRNKPKEEQKRRGRRK